MYLKLRSRTDLERLLLIQEPRDELIGQKRTYVALQTIVASIL